jgi:multisubunit Na+/H+ antiporter MnhC subunit
MRTPDDRPRQRPASASKPLNRRALVIAAMVIAAAVIAFFVLPFLFVDRTAPGVTGSVLLGHVTLAVA